LYHTKPQSLSSYHPRFNVLAKQRPQHVRLLPFHQNVSSRRAGHRPCRQVTYRQGFQIHGARHHSNRPRLYSGTRESMTGRRQAQGKEKAQKGSGDTSKRPHQSPSPSFSSLFFLTSFLRDISSPIRVSLCSITSRFAASTSSIFAFSF